MFKSETKTKTNLNKLNKFKKKKNLSLQFFEKLGGNENLIRKVL